ncbi:UVR8 [Symbiodinium necroappetens]|uniref:UVR8 protein n=1 Tax=Symbiodinium necroappetens TaxID=1628268 RepID=A0A813B9Y6_9DINO|nr:UVR8 [Symbiodinium necroappetens]
MKEVFTGGRGLAVFGEALDTKGLSGHIRAVASGAFHVCVLQEDGIVRCFGSNGCQQCSVPEDLRHVTMVAAGGQHTCAITSAGGLVCFGEDHVGQCRVPPNIPAVRAVSAGTFHTCAVTVDGQLVCFGSNRFGQCVSPEAQFTQAGTVAAVEPEESTHASSSKAVCS